MPRKYLPTQLCQVNGRMTSKQHLCYLSPGSLSTWKLKAVLKCPTFSSDLVMWENVPCSRAGWGQTPHLFFVLFTRPVVAAFIINITKTNKSFNYKRTPSSLQTTLSPPASCKGLDKPCNAVFRLTALGWGPPTEKILVGDLEKPGEKVPADLNPWDDP